MPRSAVGSASYSRVRSPGFDTRSGHLLSWRLILPLPLIQERQLCALSTGKPLRSSKCASDYCKTLNIRGVKFLRFNENNILAHFNFGVHDNPWLKIVKKI